VGAGKPAADASPFPDPASFPRTARGRRPYFFDDPNVDKLLAMIMALAGEVSVLRERLDTHERLAADGKRPSAAEVENYSAPRPVADDREAQRAEFVSRILRIVSDEMDRMSAGDAEQEYRSQIRHVS